MTLHFSIHVTVGKEEWQEEDWRCVPGVQRQGTCSQFGKRARLPKPTATLFWDGTFARPCNSSLSLQEWRAVAGSCTLNRPLHNLRHSPFIVSFLWNQRMASEKFHTSDLPVFNDPGPTEDMQKIKISFFFFPQLSERFLKGQYPRISLYKRRLTPLLTTANTVTENVSSI